MKIKKFFRGLIFNKYDEFASEMGFQDWKTAYDNTFFIFRIPEDAQWNATELPNRSWAVWNDEGQPPYPFQVFTTWEEAIIFLRNLFEQENYEDHYWEPEGFEPGENVFIKPPNNYKKDD
ncbi:hypothetical protein AM500_18975 [Bacillus sp. FJAT-18017]|uniref:hypothetical protein n=1 Tax=Bacillus sp. FJAT-18017 TaxID=1705566 RepID=UPI0006BCE7D5|nr:hypothetical protein [Bacillus sp. FJAT-18017]ALC91636.1 hypothetical protein AM500_18975 [Bacillus sp. FJAT-18017]